MEEVDLRRSLSSNGYSVDGQLDDAVNWLQIDRPTDYAQFLAVFPTWPMRVFEGSQLCFFKIPYVAGPELVEVDPEFVSWCVDWIEDNTPIFWDEGEPYVDLVAHGEKPASIPEPLLPQKMFAVQGGVGRKRPDGEWHSYKQIPTFYLHPNVQGILDEVGARFIAEELILNPLFPEEREQCQVFLTVVEVEIP